MRRTLLVALALAGCGNSSRDLTFHWDDRRVLCSTDIGDIASGNTHVVDWDAVDEQLDNAHDNGSVAIFHAHTPGVAVTLGAIERLFTDAEERGLAPVTFRDLDGPHRAAFAFAFDDNAPDQWLTAEDIFEAHHAHITLFVTRWAKMTDVQHTDISTLAAAGHDLEPHGVNHLNAVTYVAANGIDAYLNDEVLPSFTPLEQLGYSPTTFAYPFGAHDGAIDKAVLEHVARVRAVGSCL